MTRRAAVASAGKVEVTVLAECIACHQQMDIKAGEFGPDDYPCCNRCGSPVIAVKAIARRLTRRK